jgi:hypothetical protein
MQAHSRKSITLLELIIAMVLFSLVILGITNVETFSRHHLLASDKRAKLQNDLSYCLEHMAKNVSQAIGNESVFGANTAIYNYTNVLSFYKDVNGDGIRDTAVDYWASYRLNSSTLSYCARCTDYYCYTCPAGAEILSNRITAFSATSFLPGGSNYVAVSLTARWDPATAASSSDNPSLTMPSGINLPSVSAN